VNESESGIPSVNRDSNPLVEDSDDFIVSEPVSTPSVLIADEPISVQHDLDVDLEELVSTQPDNSNLVQSETEFVREEPDNLTVPEFSSTLSGFVVSDSVPVEHGLDIDVVSVQPNESVFDQHSSDINVEPQLTGSFIESTARHHSSDSGSGADGPTLKVDLIDTVSPGTKLPLEEQSYSSGDIEPRPTRHHHRRHAPKKLDLIAELGTVDCGPTEKVATASQKKRKRRHHHEEFLFIKKMRPIPELQVMPQIQCDAHYLGFIREQKMKLDHLKKRTTTSRQLRALRQTHVIEMEYEIC
jgi:hypothetical protein